MNKKTYWIINNNEPFEVDIVGKYISQDEWHESKFRYVYQVRNAATTYADEENVKREDIYLTKKEAELALSARDNLDKIRKAEEVIRKYKESVSVIAKAKKEGLTDIDIVLDLSNEGK